MKQNSLIYGQKNIMNIFMNFLLHFTPSHISEDYDLLSINVLIMMRKIDGNKALEC